MSHFSSDQTRALGQEDGAEVGVGGVVTLALELGSRLPRLQ